MDPQTALSLYAEELDVQLRTAEALKGALQHELRNRWTDSDRRISFDPNPFCTITHSLLTLQYRVDTHLEGNTGRPAATHTIFITEEELEGSVVDKAAFAASVKIWVEIIAQKFGWTPARHTLDGWYEAGKMNHLSGSRHETRKETPREEETRLWTAQQRSEAQAAEDAAIRSVIDAQVAVARRRSA